MSIPSKFSKNSTYPFLAETEASMNLERSRMINRLKFFTSATESYYKSLEFLENIAERKLINDDEVDELKKLLKKEIRVNDSICKDNARIEKQIAQVKNKRIFLEKSRNTLFVNVMKKQKRIYMLRRIESNKIDGVKQNNKKTALSDFYCTN
jgi:predicted ATP-dependent endonuclease of OLD family